jgi:aryl sulfotransferase
LIFFFFVSHFGASGVAELSPWVDLRVPPKEVKIGALEAQTQRRFMKTHLPVNALEFSPKAKYIYVARDGRDVVMSLHNHHASALPMWYGALNDTPGRVGPPIAPPSADRAAYFQEWLDKDGFPFWPFWENVRTWWAVRNLPNVLLVHFADLKADLPGMIRKIAAFLEVTIDEAKFPVIVEHCTFAWMKKNATASVPMGGAFWEGGAETFIYKGENARWTSVLSAEQSAQYKDRAVAELGEECAAWLNK